MFLAIFPTHKKGKAIAVTGRGGPYGSVTSRLPHFLDNRLTDGGEVRDILCKFHSRIVLTLEIRYYGN
jgi:hypothetical protein